MSLLLRAVTGSCMEKKEGNVVEGHFGNRSFVLCSEVVPISEVQLYDPKIMC